MKIGDLIRMKANTKTNMMPGVYILIADRYDLVGTAESIIATYYYTAIGPNGTFVPVLKTWAQDRCEVIS